jgi:hypothetical protein
VQEPIDRGSPKQLIWEGFAPFREIQITGDDHGLSFVTL